MKKSILIFLIFGFLTMSCQGQTERMEAKIMACIYENYEDQGTEFKKALSDFEQLLISEKILKDGTGISYIAIYEKIALENAFNYNPSKSFIDQINNIRVPKNSSLNKCQSKLIKNDKIEFTKGTELKIVLDSIMNSKNLSPSKVANGILSVLDESDFDLDYYKMSMFLMFDTMNYTNDDGITRKLPEFKEEGEIENDLSKAISIYIDGKNQIFVNNKKVNIEALKVQIREYEITNKSESIISLKTERETMYKTYVDVQNVINEEIRLLRQQLAQEKYSTELDKLTKEQLFEIKHVYPQKLVE